MCAWLRGAGLAGLAALAVADAAAGELDAAVGKALFDRLWVAAPSSTASADGLGPLFNGRSCASCHVGGGAGEMPAAGLLPAQSALVLRVVDDANLGLGQQIQTAGIVGHAPEARVLLSYSAVGSLRAPVFALLGSDALEAAAPRIQVSPRLAPVLDGLGLVDRIPAAEIRAGADPDDRDGDGISGFARETPGGLGRYGWKAEMPTLAAQVASAFHLDIGLSTPAYAEGWGDCTPAQTDCRDAPHGAPSGEAEISGEMLGYVTRYVAGLPAPRDAIADGRGGATFAAIGCASCHRPEWSVDGRTIRPYSDFLLHDMALASAGEAAADPLANEWRTPPLWGLGRRVAAARAESRDLALLHDGRARTVEEAILWHKGEATRAAAAYAALPAADRSALIAFLEAL